jgi:hypothetical protein
MSASGPRAEMLTQSRCCRFASWKRTSDLRIYEYTPQIRIELWILVVLLARKRLTCGTWVTQWPTNLWFDPPSSRWS